MLDHQEVIKALGISVGGFAIGAAIAIGLEWGFNYKEYNNKTIMIGEEIIKTKTYSPLSYLELIYEGGRIKEVSQRSSLTENEILRFKLNFNGNVEEMIEDSCLFGKQKLRTSSPDQNKTINWPAVNQTAQRYIAYFQR